MKVCLDLHDFSVVNNRLDLLWKLKEYFPNLKVSLFTVPNDIESSWGQYRIRKESLERIKLCLDWIQIIPHGLKHEHREMKNCSYQTFTHEVMPAIKQAFDRDGLPFVKGFLAPHWRWNEGVIKALDEAGWWGAVDRRQPSMLSTKKFYRYSHCIDEELPITDVLKLHGHIYGTSNDLGRCFDNIRELPKDVEWYFVTDFLEDKI
jgi:hypothetical protein